jgi:surface polysaccharide O-acyltransferase-like enzyme
VQKDRDTSFDAFRGIAIIAVVAIHVCNTGLACTYAPNNKWNIFFLVAYRQLLNFAVPAFLFISGYWMSKKPVKSLEDYKAFLIKRLSRILIPYLLWSCFLFGYVALRTHDINVCKIIFHLLTGGAAEPYYFIVVLAQLYVITPLLQHVNRKSYGLILMLILNIASLSSPYILRLYFNWPISFHAQAVPFYSWIIFYEIGLLVGNREDEKLLSKNTRRFILPAVLISMLIVEMEAMILLFGYDDLVFARSAIKYSSFLYSVCVILGFLLLRERFNYWPKVLVTIGKYSFGIYLIHSIVLAMVFKVAQKINIIYSFQPLYQIAALSIIISICAIVISITRKLLPKSFCSNILGF